MIDWIFLFVDHQSKLELIIGEIIVGIGVLLCALASPFFIRNRELIVELRQKIASFNSDENTAPLSLRLITAEAGCFQYGLLSILALMLFSGYSFMGIVAFRDMPFVSAGFFIFLALILGWFYLRISIGLNHKTG